MWKYPLIGRVIPRLDYLGEGKFEKIQKYLEGVVCDLKILRFSEQS